jgi:hypothetical protein
MAARLIGLAIPAVTAAGYYALWVTLGLPSIVGVLVAVLTLLGGTLALALAVAAEDETTLPVAAEDQTPTRAAEHRLARRRGAQPTRPAPRHLLPSILHR